MGTAELLKLKITLVDGEEIDLYIMSNSSVRRLERLIGVYIKTSFSGKELHFNGEILDSNKYLQNYEITDGSELFLFPLFPHEVKRNTMKVNISIKDGKRFPVMVKPSDTVVHLKNLINVYTYQHDGQILAEDQMMVFNGAELKAGYLKDANVVDDSEIVIFNRSWISKNPVQINVRKLDGEVMPIMICLSETVDSLKEHIELRADILVIDQALYYNDSPLTAGVLLLLGLQDQSEVLLRNVESPAFPVFVRQSSERMTTLHMVKSNYTIMDVKKLVKQQTDIQVDFQVLCFKESIVANRKTVKECGIESHSLLELI